MSQYLVAFNGNLLYAPALALKEKFGNLSLQSLPEESVLEVTIDGQVVQRHNFDSTTWPAEFSALRVPIKAVKVDTRCEIRINNQLFDWVLVRPIFTVQFWDINRTKQIRLTVPVLSQFTGSFMWIRYRLPSKQFYADLHSELQKRVNAFYQSFASSVQRNAVLGEKRFNLAKRLFKFSNTSYSTGVWSALLFNTSQDPLSQSQEKFYEAVSIANQPGRHWPDYNPVVPKNWLIKTLGKCIDIGLPGRTPDERDYLVWLSLLDMNFAFSELGDPEFELLSSNAPRFTWTPSASSDVIMCFQSGPTDDIPGLQRFDSIPAIEMLILRRIDNFAQLSEAPHVRTTFSYGMFQDVKLPQHYEIDVSPINDAPAQFKLAKSRFIDDVSTSTLPESTILERSVLPRISSSNGEYLFYVVLPNNTHAPLGRLAYPIYIDLTIGKVRNEKFDVVLDEVAILPRLDPFYFHVETEFTHILKRLESSVLNASKYFPTALPPGFTLEWSVQQESGSKILLTDSFALDIPAEEESAGIYRLTVDAISTNAFPIVKNESLAFTVDFVLFCQRCSSSYSALKNAHGMCQHHAVRSLQDLERSNQLVPFDPRKDVDSVNAILTGGRALNPNIYWGLATARGELTYYWLCCGRVKDDLGCYIGRHSSTEPGADLSDWLHNGPRRGTEWQLDSNTSTLKFTEIVEAYAKENFVQGVRLEWNFNQVHGGDLRPSFTFVNNFEQVGEAALTQLMSNGLQQDSLLRLFNVVDFSHSFGLWRRRRDLQLAYPSGRGLNSTKSTLEHIQLCVDLVRVFQVLRNIPVKNVARLREVRLAVLQRWFSTRIVPDQSTVEHFALKELQLFEQYSTDINAQLQRVEDQLTIYWQEEATLGRELNAFRELIDQQPNAPDLRLYFSFNVFEAEARQLARLRPQAEWKANRAALNRWLQRRFYKSKNEREFQQRIAAVNLAIYTGGLAVFGKHQFSFSTAEYVEELRMRLRDLSSHIRDEKNNLETSLRTLGESQARLLKLVLDLKEALKSTLDSTRSLFKKEEELRPDKAREAQLLHDYRDVWQAVNPGYFEKLYQKVDRGETALVWSESVFLPKIIQQTLADPAASDQILFLIRTDSLQLGSIGLLDKVLKGTTVPSFSEDIIAELFYEDDLLSKPVLNNDARLSVFFRAMDRHSSPEGFSSLPRLDNTQAALETAWNRRRQTLLLDELDAPRVLQIPGNANYVSKLDNTTTWSEMLKFYDVYRQGGDLSMSGIIFRGRTLLPQVSIGEPPASYSDAIDRWTRQQKIRNDWVDEMRRALDLLTISDTVFLRTVLESILSPEQSDRITAIAKRPAADVLFAHVAQNPGALRDVWTYLKSTSTPDESDPLMQQITQLSQSEQLKNRTATESAVAEIPALDWVPDEFVLYRQLVQKITLPPSMLPNDSWFVQLYTITTGQNWRDPSPPAIANAISKANSLLALLSKSRLPALDMLREWESARASLLRQGLEAGVDPVVWIQRFREFRDSIAVSKDRPEFRTVLLTMVMSLYDALVVLGQPFNRRWQYLHWDDVNPESYPTTPALSIESLDAAYLEDTSRGPIKWTSELGYIVDAELKRFHVDELRRVSASSLQSVREKAIESDDKWSYHQLSAPIDDPIAYLVMAVLLSGRKLVFAYQRVLDDSTAFNATKALIDVIANELAKMDLSPIQPALELMRRSQRTQITGIAYQRGDRKIEISGNPLLLRPIWGSMDQQLQKAWFTVLSYPLVEGAFFRQLSGRQHPLVFAFLASVFRIYLDQRRGSLFDYLEDVCDANSNVEADALAYFVHAFAMHHIPGHANLSISRSLFPFALRLANAVPGNAAEQLPISAETYALYLSDLQKLTHVVLRVGDPFNVASRIAQLFPTPFQRWMVLTNASNPSVERTRIPIFTTDRNAYILYKSRYDDPEQALSDPADLVQLQNARSHSVINVKIGQVTANQSGLQFFAEKFVRFTAIILEMTPSIEVLHKEHEQLLSETRRFVQDVQMQKRLTEVRSMKQEMDQFLAVANRQETSLDVFFQVTIANDRAQMLQRIAQSAGARMLPGVAGRLQEFLSQRYFFEKLGTIIPNNERSIRIMQELHAKIGDTYTPYSVAVMQLLRREVEMSTGAAAPVQNALTVLWDHVKGVVDNVLTLLALETAGLVAVPDPDKYAQQLGDLDQILKRSLLGARFNFDDFKQEFSKLQGKSLLNIDFIDAARFTALQQRLIGGNILPVLDAWANEIIKTLDTVRFLDASGTRVAPSFKLILPQLKHPSSAMTETQILSDFSNLYMALYFRDWYNRNGLDKSTVRDEFLNQIEPLAEEIAKQLLVWSERTHFWQTADALFSLAVLARDLARITDRGAILKQFNIVNPNHLIAADLSVATLDQRIKLFSEVFITQAGGINALSAKTSVLFKKPLQDLLTASNNTAWLTTAEKQLREFLKSPQLQPAYELIYLPPMQTALQNLPPDAIDDRMMPALHRLLDGWIHTTLTQSMLGWAMSFLRNPSFRHTVSKSLPDKPLMLQEEPALDLSHTAFRPLISTLPFEADRLNPTKLMELCTEIAEWESTEKIQIMSSRWPTPQFDKLRQHTNLRSFPLRDNVKVNQDTQIILNSAQWPAEQPDAFEPMFTGDFKTARKLEAVFHFGDETLDYTTMHNRYRQDFGHNPQFWLSYKGGPLPTEFPAELKRIVDESGQRLEDVFWPGVREMPMLAGWPYRSRLLNRATRKLYLQDLMRLSFEFNQWPNALDALNSVSARPVAELPQGLVQKWIDGSQADERFQHFIASTQTPSSPWGMDLYFAVRGDEVLHWSLWENRLPGINQRPQETRFREPVTELRGARFLTLRGLIDAAAIDGKDSASITLEHRVSLEKDDSFGLPRLYFPANADQLEAYKQISFDPAFPFDGFQLFNRWPMGRIMAFYASGQSRVALSIIERPLPAVLTSQLAFYDIIINALIATQGNVKNVSLRLPLGTEPLGWVNPLPNPEGGGNVMKLPSIARIL